MDVTPLIPEGRQIIQSYTAQGFKVSGKAFAGAIFVTPEKTEDWVINGSAQDITPDQIMDCLKDFDVDVLLFGTGSTSIFVKPALREFLRQKKLTIDAMDTGAACRTYNVLMAEGRRVMALLLPLDPEKGGA
jgi:uncharacterized protein